MSLFVLRDGVRVMTAPSGGGRVVHLPTGDSLAVSAEDVIFLARVTAGGLDAREPPVKKEIDKFIGFRVLTPLLNAAAKYPPTTRPPTPSRAATDAAPKFRTGLRLTRQPGTALFDVYDPKSGHTYLVHDFELSLLRMMDGRRPLAEVLETAARLGIPITLDALNQFIRYLERYSLFASLGEAGLGEEDRAMWGARTDWDETVRPLFRSGLRMHRQGHYPQAVGYFEAVLAADPGNAEAMQMLEQAQRQMPPRGPKPVEDRVEKFDALEISDAPTIVNINPQPPIPSPTVPGGPGGDDAMGIPTPTEVPAWLGTPNVPEEITEAHALTAKPKGAGLKFAVAGALLAVCALGAGWMFFKNVPEVVPPPPKVAAARDASVEIEVEEPTVRGTIDAGAPVAEAPVVVVVDAGRIQVAAVVDAGRVPVAEAPVAAASSDGWLTFKIKQRGRVNMGDLVAASDGVLSWKAAAEQRVKRNEAVGSVNGAALVAPGVGLVVQKAADKSEVKAAQVVGSILYFEAYVKAQVTGARPEPGWRCEVASEAANNSAPCKIGNVAPKGDGFFVTATVEPRWFDDAPDAVLRLSAP